MTVSLQGDHTLACKATNFLIYRRLCSPGAPPFLGLLPLDQVSKERAIASARRLLGGRSERLPMLFGRYPFFAAWLVTQSLNEEYGEAGNAVYRHIANSLEVSLEAHSQRNILFDSFCKVCERFGLPTQGFDRHVDVYLLHAGVSRAQLPHLIDAFLRAGPKKIVERFQ